jgi:hypothetical protein
MGRFSLSVVKYAPAILYLLSAMSGSSIARAVAADV